MFKIKYDNNGFIWEVVSKGSSIMIPEGYFKADTNFIFNDSIIDPEYYFPLYKYDEVTQQVFKVTDPIDYQVNSKLWGLYLNKLRDEVNYLLATKTDDEMKAIYDSSPSYKQDVIYDAIELMYAERERQYDINLVSETTFKVLLSILYIREVEGRALTAEEDATYKALLTRYFNHNSVLDGLLTTSWFNDNQEQLLQRLDGLRDECLPKRYYITGR